MLNTNKNNVMILKIKISTSTVILKSELLSKLFAKVSGNTLIIICNIAGRLVNGKNVPQKNVIGVMMKFITDDKASGFFIHKPIAMPSNPKQMADSKIPIMPAKLTIGTSKNTMATMYIKPPAIKPRVTPAKVMPIIICSDEIGLNNSVWNVLK